MSYTNKYHNTDNNSIPPYAAATHGSNRNQSDYLYTQPQQPESYTYNEAPHQNQQQQYTSSYDNKNNTSSSPASSDKQYRSTTWRQSQYYDKHGKLPLPSQEMSTFMRYTDFTIPIPFIPIKRPLPLIFSGVWLILAVYWNGVLAVVGQQHQPLNINTLSDVGHDAFAYTGRAPEGKIEWHNIYIAAYAALTFFRFLFARAFFWELLRRFFFVWGLLFILRGACDGLTQETRTTYYCFPNYDIDGDVWINGWKYVFGGIKPCSDLMFSGHTIFFTLLALQWSYYSTGIECKWCCAGPRVPRLLKFFCLPTFTATGDVENCWFIPIFAWITSAGGYLLMVSDQAHYSVDVFISALLTLAVYCTYLYYLKIAYDDNSWVSSFIIWFEGITPPLPGQALLSIMQAGTYSTKTTAALPPDYNTWHDQLQQPNYTSGASSVQQPASPAGNQPLHTIYSYTQPQQQQHLASETATPAPDLEAQNINTPSYQPLEQQPFKGAHPVTSFTSSSAAPSASVPPPSAPSYSSYETHPVQPPSADTNSLDPYFNRR